MTNQNQFFSLPDPSNADVISVVDEILTTMFGEDDASDMIDMIAAEGEDENHILNDADQVAVLAIDLAAHYSVVEQSADHIIRILQRNAVANDDGSYTIRPSAEESTLIIAFLESASSKCREQNLMGPTANFIDSSMVSMAVKVKVAVAEMSQQ